MPQLCMLMYVCELLLTSLVFTPIMLSILRVSWDSSFLFLIIRIFKYSNKKWYFNKKRLYKISRLMLDNLHSWSHTLIISLNRQYLNSTVFHFATLLLCIAIMCVVDYVWILVWCPTEIGIFRSQFLLFYTMYALKPIKSETDKYFL